MATEHATAAAVATDRRQAAATGGGRSRTAGRAGQGTAAKHGSRAAGRLGFALAMALALAVPLRAQAPDPPAGTPVPENPLPKGAERDARQAVAIPVAGASLDELERKVAADPDDLRAGAEYRQGCIAEKAYDRCIGVLEALAGEHPGSHALHLNRGYAYVDKIPAAGAVTQVLLADNALKRFTEALEIEESWLALYTRGNSYVYWPPIFGRTKLGIADLEKAVGMSEELGSEAPPYHAHAYAALGDAHWRLGDLEAARGVWRRGLDRFPADAALARRLELEGEALGEHLDAIYALGQRVDTSLAELWEAR